MYHRNRQTGAAEAAPKKGDSIMQNVFSGEILNITPFKQGFVFAAKDTVKLLEAVLRPGDKINLEGNNQKQADFLAEHAISIVSTIAADYIGHGVNVGFYTNGWDIDVRDDSEYTEGKDDEKMDNPKLEPDSGREHMKSLDIILSRLSLSKKPSDMMEILRDGFEHVTGNVTHVIISTYRDDALYDFFREHMTGNSLYWIVPEREGNEVDLRYSGMFRWDV